MPLCGITETSSDAESVEVVHITIDQDWDNKVYIESFLKVLGERGLSYDITYDGINDIPVMKNV